MAKAMRPASSPDIGSWTIPASNGSGSSNATGLSRGARRSSYHGTSFLPKLTIPPPAAPLSPEISPEYFSSTSPQSDSSTTPTATPIPKLPTTPERVRGWLGGKELLSSVHLAAELEVVESEDSSGAKGTSDSTLKGRIFRRAAGDAFASITPDPQSPMEDYHSHFGSTSLSTPSSHPVVGTTKSESQDYLNLHLMGELLSRADSPSPPMPIEDPPLASSAIGKTPGDKVSRDAISPSLATAKLKLQPTFSPCGHHDQHQLEEGTTAPGSFIPANSDAPAWKRLISPTLFPHEVIPTIEAIFTSEDEVKMIFGLRADDAQSFVDAIHGVRFVFLLSRGAF